MNRFRLRVMSILSWAALLGRVHVVGSAEQEPSAHKKSVDATAVPAASNNDSGAPKSLLIDKAQMAGCELHAIGMYMTARHSKDDRAYVEIAETEQPIVVVLTSYFAVQWNITIAPKAKVKQIILAGYNAQDLAEPHPNVPVFWQTYFPEANRESKDYFWAYGWHTEYGRDLKAKLKKLKHTVLNVVLYLLNLSHMLKKKKSLPGRLLWR